MSTKIQIDNILNEEEIKMRRGKVKKVNYYDSYRDKLERRDYVSFNSRDLLYFYKDIARYNNIRFISTTTTDIRYMKNLKEARKYLENVEIMLIIEFLYSSNQNYLDKETLHPGILLTGWINKLVKDTKLWLKGEYEVEGDTYE